MLKAAPAAIGRGLGRVESSMTRRSTGLVQAGVLNCLIYDSLAEKNKETWQLLVGEVGPSRNF